MTELTIVEPRGVLIDYARTNAEDPSLYGRIPELGELMSLELSQDVKIGLECTPLTRIVSDGIGPNPEHFWVQIIERRGVQGFIGKVLNDLQPGFGVKHGEHLLFCANNIIEIGRE